MSDVFGNDAVSVIETIMANAPENKEEAIARYAKLGKVQGEGSLSREKALLCVASDVASGRLIWRKPKVGAKSATDIPSDVEEAANAFLNAETDVGAAGTRRNYVADFNKVGRFAAFGREHNAMAVVDTLDKALAVATTKRKAKVACYDNARIILTVSGAPFVKERKVGKTAPITEAEIESAVVKPAKQEASFDQWLLGDADKKTDGVRGKIAEAAGDVGTNPLLDAIVSAINDYADSLTAEADKAEAFASIGAEMERLVKLGIMKQHKNGAYVLVKQDA